MRMRRPLVLEPGRSALLTVIVERAFEAALNRGLFHGMSEPAAKLMIVARVLRTIECGECDIDKLMAIALGDIDTRERAAA
jgi:hypothetical protein